MNQTSLVVDLLRFTDGNPCPFGVSQGKDALRKLSDFVEQHPDVSVFGISLKGIEATDASFPRESVIALAKQFRGEKFFFLTHLPSRDVIDNWSYAARAKEQPMVIWNGDEFEVIPEMSPATSTLVNYVLKKGSATTPQVAVGLNMSVPNASTRLKNLVNQGYLMRSEDVAETGGIEFKYKAIR
jgi:hypothetical protein